MKFSGSKTAKLLIKLVITVVLVFLVIRYIGIRDIYNELSSLNPSYIIYTIFLIIPLILLKAIRWKGVASIVNASITTGVSVIYTLISIAFAMVTPSRLGEFVKVKYLTDKTGIRYLKSFVTVVIDKMFDVIAMAFLGLLGFYLIKITEFTKFFLILFIIYFVILILVFIFFKKAMAVAPYFIPKKYKEGFKRMSLNRAIYLKSTLISIGIWIVLSIQAYFILNALGAEVSILVTITAVPLMALSAMIPISIGGIGIREIIAISFFALIGISAEKSATFSLMYTAITSGIPAIIGAFIYLFYKKVPKKRNRKNF